MYIYTDEELAQMAIEQRNAWLDDFREEIMDEIGRRYADERRIERAEWNQITDDMFTTEELYRLNYDVELDIS